MDSCTTTTKPKIELSSLLYYLKSLSSCESCQKSPTYQKLLKCHHNICLDCLGRSRNPDGLNPLIQCPVCEMSQGIPCGFGAVLPESLYVSRLNKVINRLQELQIDNAALTEEQKKEDVQLKRLQSPVQDMMFDIEIQLDRLKLLLEASGNLKSEIQTVTEATITAIQVKKDGEILARRHAEDLACSDINEETCVGEAVMIRAEKALEEASEKGQDGALPDSDMKCLYAELQDASDKLIRELNSRNYLKKGGYVRLLNPKLPNNKLARTLNNNIPVDSVGIYMGPLQPEHHMEFQDLVWVMFPECPNWLGKESHLIRTKSKCYLPFMGDTVKRMDRFKSGQQAEQGIIKDLELTESYEDNHKSYKVKVMLECLKTKKKYRVNYTEVEPIKGFGYHIGERVKVNSSVKEPSLGWGGVTASSVGSVKDFITEADTELVVVKFPENSDWKGRKEDIAIHKAPAVGDKAKVKVSVSEPYFKWGGITHHSRGEIKKIYYDEQLEERVAEVKFPAQDFNHQFLLSEIEVADDEEDATEERVSLAQLLMAMQLRQMEQQFTFGGGLGFFHHYNGSDDDDDYYYYGSD